eukprot:3325626-Amphidinium_carterae.1
MSQPLCLKPGGFLLTRLVRYIVVEVERTPPRVSSSTHFFLKEREITKHAKPEWQLVVGKRGRKGRCDVLSSAAGGSPLECANSLAIGLHCWSERWTMTRKNSILQSQTTNKLLQRTVKKTMSLKELQAPILDDEAWLADAQPSEPSGTQVGTLCVDDETTSLSTDYLREDLSSSDNDVIS